MVALLNSPQTGVINRRLALLSVISVVLLPPTLITGIFGMNVDGLPFKDQSAYGFVLTMGLMAVSVVALEHDLITPKRILNFADSSRTRVA